jgi:hypothetical protein
MNDHSYYKCDGYHICFQFSMKKNVWPSSLTSEDRSESQPAAGDFSAHAADPFIGIVSSLTLAQMNPLVLS